MFTSCACSLAFTHLLLVFPPPWTTALQHAHAALQKLACLDSDMGQVSGFHALDAGVHRPHQPVGLLQPDGGLTLLGGGTRSVEVQRRISNRERARDAFFQLLRQMAPWVSALDGTALEVMSQVRLPGGGGDRERGPGFLRTSQKTISKKLHFLASFESDCLECEGFG